MQTTKGMKTSDLRIAAPCTLDWKKMTPAEGGRFCGECKKVVRDLSKLTRAEARKLVVERSGDLCVRYVHNAKGDVFFADMPSNVVPASMVNRAARAAFAAAVVALGGCHSASNGEPLSDTSDKYVADDDDDQSYEAMGAIEHIPPTDDVPEPDDAGPDATKHAPDAAPEVDASVPETDAGPSDQSD